MGLLSIIRKIKRKEKEMHILMVGLDNSGKTTIVLKINGEDTSVISPTLGFNIKTIKYHRYSLNIWDVGGQKTTRSYWRNYFEQTDGLVWVVDSSDIRRLDDCRAELHNLLKEERLVGASLLVFANKQDIQGALKPTEIAKLREAQRADGPAYVLAIGTANPANCVRQDEYADYYFRVTNNEHLTKLKSKLNRICHNSGIKKRYFHHTEELLQGHPEILDRTLPSLDARMDMLATAVPELAAVASGKAIVEWGRPATDITHLVVSTYSGAHMPGVDLRLASLLGLHPTVRRAVLYCKGCASGTTTLHLAKDIAENNRDARVLVVCAELSLVFLRAPDEADMDTIIMQALFGDGAGAVIVGADPMRFVEHPLFETVAASQSVIPASHHTVVGWYREDGLVLHPSVEMPAMIRENIEPCLAGALGSSCRWNDLFWAVHPGGRAILDSVEAALQLEPEKLGASRHVLSEYGNMSGPTLFFVLDEIRRRPDDHHGMGVMLGIGPGISIEMMVLRRHGEHVG